MEGLKNIMEDAVEYQLNKLLPTMPNVCSCDNCKLDMASYALNRLSPQYVAEVEILTVVISAINKIGSHPQHD